MTTKFNIGNYVYGVFGNSILHLSFSEIRIDSNKTVTYYFNIKNARYVEKKEYEIFATRKELVDFLLEE